MENQACCMKEPAGSCGTGGGKDGCCWMTLVKGAIVGGIVFFVYTWLSWHYLPWHKTTVQSFTNEKAVATVLAKEADKSGVYVLPKMGGTESVKPYAFMTIAKDGMDWKVGMKDMMMKEALLALVIGALVTCLLKKVAGGCCTIKTSLKIGLLVAVMAYVPCMIWHALPADYALAGMFDDVVGVVLVGYFISRFVLCGSACGDKK